MDKKRTEITELETKMAAPNFWDDHSAAQSVISELTRLKNLVNPLTSLKKRTEDLRALFELAEESDEDPALAEELSSETSSLKKSLDTAENRIFPERPARLLQRDSHNPRRRRRHRKLRWAEMLLRMYLALGGKARI